jgi:hypothetical protein
MNTNDGARDDRPRVRESLRMAGGGPEPDMERLLAAVPIILAEARRRRRLREQSPWTPVVSLAWRALPRMAAAAVLLLIASAAVLLGEQGSGGRERPDLDSILLIGTDTAGVEDLILGAPAAGEAGREGDHG